MFVDSFFSEECQRGQRVLIAEYSMVNENLLIQIGKKIDSRIIVKKHRYAMLEKMDINMSWFTTDQSEGFVFLVKFDELDRLMREDENTIGIVLINPVFYNGSHKAYNGRVKVSGHLHSVFRILSIQIIEK